MHALSQPTPLREFRFRRTLRISIFYTLAVTLTLTIPSNQAYLAAIVIFTFMAYYKWNPSFTNQWVTAAAVICPLYLLITPVLIQWPFIFLAISLGLFVFFIYYFYSGQYIIFNVVAAATTALIVITGIINPNTALDFIWVWLFGAALGFLVIKTSNISIYPQLARHHLEASILIELRTSMIVLTNTLADLTREKHQATLDNLQTPEKFMDLYALLSAGEFENKLVKQNLDHYNALINQLKLFRYQIRDLYNKVNFFDTAVREDSQQTMKEIIEELASIYEYIFNGITNNQAIAPYPESINHQLNLLHARFQAAQKQQDLKQYKLGRIYAWTALLKTLEETLSNLNDIRKLTNTIYSTKARKPKKQKRSLKLTLPSTLNVEALQLSTKMLIGLLCVLFFNIGLNWFGGASTVITAVFTILFIMYRPHISQSIRFSYYRFFGIFAGALGGILTLLLYAIFTNAFFFIALFFSCTLIYVYFSLTDHKNMYFAYQATMVYTMVAVAFFSTTAPIMVALFRLGGVLEGIIIALLTTALFWHLSPLKQIKRYLSIMLESQAELFEYILTKRFSKKEMEPLLLLNQTESAYMSLIDIIDDMGTIKWYRRLITEPLLEIIETTRRLTFTIETLTANLIHSRSSEFIENYLPTLAQAALPIKEDWLAIKNEILMPKTLLNTHALEAQNERLSKLLLDVRKIQPEQESVPSIELMKEFSSLTLALKRIISLLEHLSAVNNGIINAQVASPSVMQ